MRLPLSGFPVCLAECLFDITHPLLDLVFHLLRSALSLLRFVTGQFSDLRWTCLLHPWQRPHLIAVHGCSLNAAHYIFNPTTIPKDRLSASV